MVCKTRFKKFKELLQILIINHSMMASGPRRRQGLPINVVNVMREARVSHNSGYSKLVPRYLSIKCLFIITIFLRFFKLTISIILLYCIRDVLW